MRLNFSLLTAILLLVCLAGGAQNNTIQIRPGSGIGKLKLGMTEAQVSAVLGKDMERQTYKQVMNDFKKFNKDMAIDSVTQFILGFDKCLTVSDEMQQNIPIFKLYFSGDELNYIAVTSYGTAEKSAERVLLGKNFIFGMEKQQVESLLGTDHITHIYNEDPEFIYPVKGLDLLFSENKLRYLGLFKPDPNFLKRIGWRRPVIRQEWNSLY